MQAVPRGFLCLPDEVIGLVTGVAGLQSYMFWRPVLASKGKSELGFLNSKKTALHGDCLGLGLVIYWGVGERNVAGPESGNWPDCGFCSWIEDAGEGEDIQGRFL